MCCKHSLSANYVGSKDAPDGTQAGLEDAGRLECKAGLQMSEPGGPLRL